MVQACSFLSSVLSLLLLTGYLFWLNHYSCNLAFWSSLLHNIGASSAGSKANILPVNKLYLNLLSCGGVDAAESADMSLQADTSCHWLSRQLRQLAAAAEGGGSWRNRGRIRSCSMEAVAVVRNVKFMTAAVSAEPAVVCRLQVQYNIVMHSYDRRCHLLTILNVNVDQLSSRNIFKCHHNIWMNHDVSKKTFKTKIYILLANFLFWPKYFCGCCDIGSWLVVAGMYGHMSG